MIVSRIQLHCDGANCDRHYPPNGAADGSIFTHSDLRQHARNVGWLRTQGKDYCATHATLIAAGQKAASAMSRKFRRPGLEAR